MVPNQGDLRELQRRLLYFIALKIRGLSILIFCLLLICKNLVWDANRFIMYCFEACCNLLFGDRSDGPSMSGHPFSTRYEIYIHVCIHISNIHIYIYIILFRGLVTDHGSSITLSWLPWPSSSAEAATFREMSETCSKWLGMRACSKWRAEAYFRTPSEGVSLFRFMKGTGNENSAQDAYFPLCFTFFGLGHGHCCGMIQHIFAFSGPL